MNLVDSSGWLEYVVDGPNADYFAPVIEAVDDLLIPTISVLEIFKWIARERDEDQALRAIAWMQQGHIVDLDTAIAIDAARLGRTYKLPLADSIMLATAHAYDARLWTQDAHFADVPDVEYRPKPPRR